MNNYIKIVLLLFVLLIVTGSLLSQQNDDVSIANQLRFYTDFAGFYNFTDKTKTYQEIYISIPNYQLSYIKKNAIYLAGYQLSIEIKDSNDVVVAQQQWQNFNQVDYLKQAESLTSLEIGAFVLAPGTYTLSIKITDLNSGAVGFTDKAMTVPAFATEGIQLSEIELARSIKHNETTNKFVKNNIEVLPNPSRVLGIESPFAYFYVEIYNINQSTSQPQQLTREFSIVDENGNIVKSSQKVVQPQGSSSIWAEKVNTLDIVSGKYTLKLRVIDEQSGETAAQQAEFWITNPFKTISLAQYDEQDFQQFRAQIEYLVESQELEFFDQLNAEGKIQFINDFWRSKTPEFRIEHLKRFYSAQQRFASPTMPGWKADRGRVYIMYGPPDEIVREPASVDSRAYEIWIYETLKKQGRVEFVFVDQGIVGNFQLVHSTLKSGKRLEIYNPDWINEVKIAR